MIAGLERTSNTTWLGFCSCNFCSTPGSTAMVFFASNVLRHILCHVVLYQKFVNAMGHH
jgi:hypothetical protein